MLMTESEPVFSVGRLCVKIAGRDAGATSVVVDTVNEQTVLIDGQTRRRSCNIKHLEALAPVLSLKKGASHADVEKEFKKLGIAVRQTKPKKKTTEPPIKSPEEKQKQSKAKKE